eukprot:jgi/Psemu1/291198/fgenesh1_pg.647_\
MKVQSVVLLSTGLIGAYEFGSANANGRGNGSDGVGVTLAEARAAPDTDPELAGCVLAPIESEEDLIAVSDAIPPCKAAYTAVTKDALTTYREARACLGEGRIPFNCDYSSLKHALDGLWGDAYLRPNAGTFGACSLREWFSDGELLLAGVDPWCPALREGWTNGSGSGSGSDVSASSASASVVPSGAVWNAGDTVYCGDGPIPDAAAAFATEYSYNDDSNSDEPTAYLKAVNGAEALDGAVYRCCAERIATCYRD